MAARIVIVGGGPAGLGAAPRTVAAAADVDPHSLVPCRRSRPVCAQGGMSGAVNTRGEGGSTRRRCADAIHGGDSLAHRPPVKAMAAAPGIIGLFDRMGGPFHRTAKGHIDVRRFGGTRYRRTPLAGATTGRQRPCARDGQVRRLDVGGRVRRREHGDCLRPALEGTGRCVSALFPDRHSLEIAPGRGDAGILATGDAMGTVFGPSTNSMIDAAGATAEAYRAGMACANREKAQVHPTAIPGEDKGRLMPECARGEGGRVWMWRARRPWCRLEEWCRANGSLVPHDVATRAIFRVVGDLGLGIAGENTAYLDVSHLPREALGTKLEGILQAHETFVREDPHRVPMRALAAMRRAMGRLSVDGGRVTNARGLFAGGACDDQCHGAHRPGANFLLSDPFAGLRAGEKAVRRARGPEGARDAEAAFSPALGREEARERRRFALRGGENHRALHAELGAPTTRAATAVRHTDRVLAAQATIRDLKARRARAALPDAGGYAHAGLEFTGRLGPRLALSHAIAAGARLRDESRGAHHGPEWPERDHERFLGTTRAPFARRSGHRARGCRRVADRASSAPRRRGRLMHGHDAGFDAQATVRLEILRRPSPDAMARGERIAVPRRANMNAILAPMLIRRQPVTAGGKATTPVFWESNCLEEVCGSRPMRSSGKAPEACSALVDALEQPIRLEPTRSFPVVRGLAVDRSRMVRALDRVRAPVPIDGTQGLGPGPSQGSEERERRYRMSCGMTSYVCLEACPNYTLEGDFVGVFAINQVRLFNGHPTGRVAADARLGALLGDGGMQACDNAQSCEASGPKEIPRTDSIAARNRAANRRAPVRLVER